MAFSSMSGATVGRGLVGELDVGVDRSALFVVVEGVIVSHAADHLRRAAVPGAALTKGRSRPSPLPWKTSRVPLSDS